MGSNKRKRLSHKLVTADTKSSPRQLIVGLICALACLTSYVFVTLIVAFNESSVWKMVFTSIFIAAIAWLAYIVIVINNLSFRRANTKFAHDSYIELVVLAVISVAFAFFMWQSGPTVRNNNEWNKLYEKSSQ